MGLLLAQAVPTAFADQLIYQIGIKSEAALLSAKLLNSSTVITSEAAAADRRRTDLGIGEGDFLTLTATKTKPNLTDEEREQVKDLLKTAVWSIDPDDSVIAVISAVGNANSRIGDKVVLYIKVPIKQQAPITYRTDPPPDPEVETPEDKKVNGKIIKVKATIPSLSDVSPAEAEFTIRTPGAIIGKVPPGSSSGLGANMTGVRWLIRWIPSPVSVNFGGGVWLREIPREGGQLFPLNGNTIFHTLTTSSVHQPTIAFKAISSSHGGVPDMVSSVYDPGNPFLPRRAISATEEAYWECGCTWAGAKVTSPPTSGDNSSSMNLLGETPDFQQIFRASPVKNNQPTSAGTTVFLFDFIEIEKVGTKVWRGFSPAPLSTSHEGASDNFPQ